MGSEGRKSILGVGERTAEVGGLRNLGKQNSRQQGWTGKPPMHSGPSYNSCFACCWHLGQASAHPGVHSCRTEG